MKYKIKNKILLTTICSLLLLTSLSGCLGGGSDNSISSFNPQPNQNNANNYFTTYAPYSNNANNTVIQIQFSDSTKTTAIGMSLFSLSTYTPDSPTSTAIINYNLSSSGIESQNYIINSISSSQVGNLELKGNNIIFNLNFSQTSKGLFGELSTIMVANMNQQNAQSGSYIGHCFNLPSILTNTGTNYGNDVCQYSLNSNGDFQIFDYSINNTQNQTNLCSAGNWSQSATNPFFYNLNCTGLNGKSISIMSSFESFENSFIMNPLIDYAISGNANTTYVSTMFQESSLNSFSPNGNTLIQLNLNTASGINQYSDLLTNNALTSQLCSQLSQVGICILLDYPTNYNIPFGVKQIQLPTSVTTNPLIIGSSNIGLFVDNNMYSYYLN